jgi:hypothetical protein
VRDFNEGLYARKGRDGSVPAAQWLPRRTQAVAKDTGEKQLVWSRSARQPAIVARASGTHLPQQVPSPVVRLSSVTEEMPPLTAERMWRSETALQTHTIMGLL